ncbi:ABC transporter permease [Flavisolibacter tropicus]|uniref:ABC transporter permease n=1 Tax=Flavisolibacter tropicus TaxID=1492898 RepID=A0A172TRT2_9BACT|nr:ABC transporter permease [Flavisolibacter tropicus]ANE49740.1 hypothetical protein SY85_03770 [Flavisolibacter tropicus]
MFFRNIKQIFRSLWRHKSFTLINLLGLSIGIAAVVIIFLIVKHENSFDKFLGDRNSIYRVVTKQSREDKIEYEAETPYPTARFLRNEMASMPITQIHFSDNANVRIGNQDPFEEKNIIFADSLFFSVFDFSGIEKFWLKGNQAKALNAPRQAVLTATTAKRYFGDQDPLGQIIRIDNKVDVQVVGLIKDIPAATHLPITMLLSLGTLTTEFMGGLDPDNWNFTSNGYTYVRLQNINAVASVNSALAAIVKKYGAEERDRNKQMYLQPLSEVHFDTTFENSNPTYTVSKKYLTMLWLLGCFIVLIACVNYINLSTSQAFTKAKEVGVRKSIGASKGQLFLYYMQETVIVTLIAAIIGFVVAGLTLPYVNTILNKSLSFNQLIDLSFLSGALLALLVVSLLSGAYPALVLAGFNPITALKNQLNIPSKQSTLLRKGLVVFQFATSIALIICTIIIARQMDYFHQKKLGFNKEAVVEIPLPDSDSAKIESFRNALQTQAGIQNITFCLGAPVSDNGISVGLRAPQLPSNIEYTAKVIPCDKEYIKAYQMKLRAGRWFLSSEEKNIGSAVVVNTAMIKTLGYKKPEEAIGKIIELGLNNIRPIIIGVTEDFHTTSLHDEIKPVVLTPFPPFYYAAGIRMNPGNMHQILSKIEQAWKKIYPESVYTFSFIDDALATLYEQETKDYNLFKAFSVISIFICCIGLWGLITFIVVRKTKEIGIRKVLGSSVHSIVFLLSRDFIKLVALALLIASPIAWYFMNQWLQDFVYRIHISWWMFLMAGLVAMLIALVSISFQTVKAAKANPVKNLRTE